MVISITPALRCDPYNLCIMERSAFLLVGNGRVVTNDDRQPFLEEGCISIHDGLISGIGPTSNLREAHPHARFLDAHGHFILPGLINAQTSLTSVFARGMPFNGANSGDDNQIFERDRRRIAKALTLDDVYWSAMVGMIDSVRHGVTTIFDRHASPGAVPGSLSRIADAAVLTGLRGCLCYEVSDRDGAEAAAQGIEENRMLLQRYEDSPDNRLRALFGLHASFALSDETLARCRQVASDFNAGFNVRTAEAKSDVEHCLRAHGMRIIRRWNKLGILGPRTLAAHCVHVDDREIEVLRDTKTSVVHNPQSNMSNAAGCAPVTEMMRRGVRVGLGTDGSTTDMFESMGSARLLAENSARDHGQGSIELPTMLLRENSGIASDCFGKPAGKLIPGALADVVIVNYDPPTPFTAENLNSHILFGFSGDAVITTIIGGQALKRCACIAENSLPD